MVNKDDFVKYAQEQFGKEIVFEKSNKPDTLDSMFGIPRDDYYKKLLDELDRSMECALEADPRTFADRDCEYGWLFDDIVDWRKKLRGLNARTESSEKSAAWVGENLEQVKLQDDNNPISEMIERRKAIKNSSERV